MATVYTEVWTKEVIKGLQSGLKDTFLDGVKDYSRYVTGDDEAQVIHSTYFGVQPDVLINNTTYPIPIQDLNGADISISLDKYQTKVTPITDDELFALAYDKIKETKDSHVTSILKNRLKKAIHAIGPNSHAANHPVLLTTGATTVDGRKRMKWDDVINLREAYAAAGFEIEDLRLILCAEHVNDLLLADTNFSKSYANFKDGIITNQLGFEIREYSQNPYYDAATKGKLSFGAVPTATSTRASVVFPVSKVGKAMGLTKMYWSKAENDPQNQRNLVNFRNYFIAMPLISDGFAAIVSDKQ